MRSAGSPVEKEEPEFKVDLIIEGIAQDVILKDEERMGQIQEVVEIFTNWKPYQINCWRFGEGRKIHQVQRRVDPHNSRTWQYWIARVGTDIRNRPVPISLEAHTGGIDLLRLRHLSSARWGTITKNQSQIPGYDSSLLPCTSEVLKR